MPNPPREDMLELLKQMRECCWSFVSGHPWPAESVDALMRRIDVARRDESLHHVKVEIRNGVPVITAPRHITLELRNYDQGVHFIERHTLFGGRIEVLEPEQPAPIRSGPATLIQ